MLAPSAVVVEYGYVGTLLKSCGTETPCERNTPSSEYVMIVCYDSTLLFAGYVSSLFIV